MGPLTALTLVGFYEFGVSKLLSKLKNDQRTLGIYLDWATTHNQHCNKQQQIGLVENEVEIEPWNIIEFKGYDLTLTEVSEQLAPMEKNIKRIEKFSLLCRWHDYINS